MPSYLSANDYRLVLLAALDANGFDRPSAERLLELRWPMDSPGAICECSGRGLLLEMADISDWLEANDWETVDPAEIMFSERGINNLLEWAAENERGQPTDSAFVDERAPGLMDHLRRSEVASCQIN
jgi:hypothetical protein